jgi:hypothetical protein
MSIQAEYISKDLEDGAVTSIPCEDHELRISTRKLLWKLDTRCLTANRVLRLCKANEPPKDPTTIHPARLVLVLGSY